MPDPRLARPTWRGRTNVDALTIACIEHAEQIGGHEFVVTQGSYQPPGGGDAKSKGTHDGGGVVDLRWCGHPTCLLALRKAGMAAWLRTPLQGFTYHLHAVVIGHPLLSPSAAGQVTAYLNGRNGLRSNGPDDGPRLDPIPLPVWPYPPEDDMADYADQLDRIEAALKGFEVRERNRDKTEKERDKRRNQRQVRLLRELRDLLANTTPLPGVTHRLAEIDAVLAEDADE